MRKSFLLAALTALAATRPADLAFEKRTLDLGGNETAAHLSRAALNVAKI